MKFRSQFGIIALLITSCLHAQEPVFEEIEVNVVEPKKKEETFPKLKLGGVFQARYLVNLKDNVDVNGLNYTNGKGVNNSFEIKRMRVS